MDLTGAWLQGQKALDTHSPAPIFPALPKIDRAVGVPAAGLSADGLPSQLGGTAPLAGVASESRQGRWEQAGFCAALDLGTNNCRLMVASRTEGGFRVLDSYSRIVRLGEGLQLTGELNADAMNRTLEALHTCVDRLGRHRPIRLRAVATEACRRARNGQAFVERIRKETGFEFEIISGKEEAELAVESCSALLFDPVWKRSSDLAKDAQPEQDWGLLLDVGGGSTEIAWMQLDQASRKYTLVGYVSLPIGVITLAEQFPHRRPGTYRAMLDVVSESLAAFEQTHQIRRYIAEDRVRVVGTSGTVTTLASLDLDLPRYIRQAVDGYRLQPDNARRAIGRLHRMGMEGMRVHPCIGSERATYVMPGCAIFEAFLSLWPASVVVADRGLRDGLLLRMMREESGGLHSGQPWPHVRRAGERPVAPD
ncbi:Ppx/GppA phosphatase family protein [Acetobacter sp.]|jgi:exopolyphosphatase/guanosine-5'-triphosphate,3'-diphosphate pyrophosphatase|uniref:Ppx/GppA phosphatase family protein n=1 Tax=Acetobacter sp. TaxID=440 RepID=UPI0025B8D3BA|nr:Ppx/GppA phosphatase family protein [Acetobacter sp.]MCH4090550.1 Ppx/GppA family phosphatase [Acetobacter sp.]MCI1299244.1 Ppx/GppA family phosphatase [Acetobacter sp.]MCI1315791.1 Ppx/GppA family phosphatase [Acetobacter sp.]